jgi:predicted transcriptional regulator
VQKEVGEELQRIADEEDRSLSYVAARVLQRWYDSNYQSIEENEDGSVDERRG